MAGPATSGGIDHFHSRIKRRDLASTIEARSLFAMDYIASVRELEQVIRVTKMPMINPGR